MAYDPSTLWKIIVIYICLKSNINGLPTIDTYYHRYEILFIYIDICDEVLHLIKFNNEIYTLTL